MPSKAPFRGRILMSVAVANPPASRDNRQGQRRTFSFRGANGYRLESITATNRKGDATSDLGNGAVATDRESSSPNKAPRKRHRTMGPKSSVQDVDRDKLIDSGLSIEPSQREADACSQTSISQISPRELKTWKTSSRSLLNAKQTSATASPDETGSEERTSSGADQSDSDISER